MTTSLSFETVTLKQQARYQSLLSQCPQIASDYSFINLLSWRDAHGLEWAFCEDLVWIRQTIPESVYWAPVGDWSIISWSSILNRHFSSPIQMIRVPEGLNDLLARDHQLEMTTKEQRDHWDYLYNVEALVNLKGNRFHKKKNLVRQFEKKYPDYQYRLFGSDTAAEALALQSDWCTWRDCEASQSLSAENSAIEKVFQDWQSLPNLMAGGIWVDNQMVAYTVGEQLAPQLLLIHFEKADPGFKGAYQAINRLFLADHQSRFEIVNRMQDLGNPGLRRAKESYHPIDFTRKFEVTVEIA